MALLSSSCHHAYHGRLQPGLAETRRHPSSKRRPWVAGGRKELSRAEQPVARTSEDSPSLAEIRSRERWGGPRSELLGSHCLSSGEERRENSIIEPFMQREVSESRKAPLSRCEIS